MQFRSIILSGVIGTSILCSAAQQANAQALTNDFTYQGVLENAGGPVNGQFDLRFSLWDASIVGTQIGANVPINNVTITDGLVTATLNFGVNAFSGSRRWVQVEIDATPGGGAGPFTLLLPRQELKAAPYALFALSGSGQWTPNGTALNYTAGNVSVGTSVTGARMTIYPATGGGLQTGLLVRNTDPSLQTTAASFITDSASGVAVAASVGAGNGAAGRAVSATSGATNGMGVYGSNTSVTGNAYGVYGISSSTSGRGVYGVASANSGTTYGVYGQTNSADGYGGYFNGKVFAGDWLGVGRSTNTIPTEAMGVYRNSTGFVGVIAESADTGEPYFGYATAGSLDAYHYYDSSSDAWRMVVNATRMTVLGSSGHVGIGTTTPEVRLHVEGGTDSAVGGGGFIVTGDTASLNISMDNNEIMARNNGAAATLTLNHAGGDVTISPAGTGRLITRVLQITGGADLSEQFEVCDAQIKPEPGMVVVIDPKNPGALVPASSAYDKKVAGIISGAGGVATGMMMGHTGTIADGDHPVALTGRVYCLVDATDAAIEPGDMLTTSNTAGHAMKAMDGDRSHGAVIGKAMTAMPRGEKGLVLVLVNLQ